MKTQVDTDKLYNFISAFQRWVSVKTGAVDSSLLPSDDYLIKRFDEMMATIDELNKHIRECPSE